MSLTTSRQKLYAIRFGGVLSIAAVVLVFDRLSKAWVRHHFFLGQSRPLASWFSITYVQNTGTAFGFFQGNNKALGIFAFLILCALLYGARGLSERGGLWGALGVALVMGGAVGNIVDRIHFGRVIDFLDFHIWPVFNLADTAITLGALAILLGFWLARE